MGTMHHYRSGSTKSNKKIKTMKHVKLFEEYTEQDLEDLMSDLYSVGLAGKHRIKIKFKASSPDYEISGTAVGVSQDLRTAAEFALAAAWNFQVNGNSDQSERFLKVPDVLTTKEQVKTVFDYADQTADIDSDSLEKEISALMQGEIGPDFDVFDPQEASVIRDTVLNEPDGGHLEDAYFKELSLEDYEDDEDEDE
jgi:hypothetical protein